jgi:hypothetical protein
MLVSGRGAPDADDAPHKDPASSAADVTLSTTVRKPVRITGSLV